MAEDAASGHASLGWAEGSSSSSSSSGAQLLLELPPDILLRQVVLPHLSPDDKAALRCTNRACRRLVNAGTLSCVLDVAGSTPHVHTQIPVSFPGLRHLSIINTAEAAAGRSAPAAPATSSSSGSSDCAVGLQDQLPLLLHQLPHLSSLRYLGPSDRRQPGLDITPALEQLLPLQTTPTPTAAPPPAHTDTQEKTTTPATAASEQQQQQQVSPVVVGAGLCELELRGGVLPDRLMSVVGGLWGLRHISLSSTTAINTAPLAALTALTHVNLTVTPPLCCMLRPLSRLPLLAVLYLAALSPARGWGAALMLLGCCPLRDLTLNFADVCDGDMQQLAAALGGLTRLDLNCSRHLSPAAIPPLASLTSLRSLHLEQTGLQLGPQELNTLGASCTQLTQLAAEFDLRQLPPPPPPAPLTGSPPRTTTTGWINRQPDVGPNVVQLQQQGALQLPQVQHLWVSNTNTTSSSSISCWPLLRRLVISGGCSTGNLSKLLSAFSPSLLSLSLNGLGPNGNEVVQQLASRAPQLQELDLSGCGSINQQGCELLGSSLSRLTTLRLSEACLPPGHLLLLLQGLAQHRALVCLQCCRCRGLDDGVLLQGVGPLGGSLQQLELVGCDGVTGGGLMQLAGQLRGLKGLHVKGCRGVEPGIGRAWECAAAAAAGAAGTWHHQAVHGLSADACWPRCGQPVCSAGTQLVVVCEP